MQAIVETHLYYCVMAMSLQKGFDSELDELRKIRDHAGQFLIDLEVKERQESGIPTSKNWLQPCQWLLH